MHILKFFESCITLSFIFHLLPLPQPKPKSSIKPTQQVSDIYCALMCCLNDWKNVFRSGKKFPLKLEQQLGMSKSWWTKVNTGLMETFTKLVFCIVTLSFPLVFVFSQLVVQTL